MRIHAVKPANHTKNPIPDLITSENKHKKNLLKILFKETKTLNMELVSFCD